MYEGTSIYEIPSNLYDVPYCEYHFGEHGRIVEIPGRERYEWFDESIAIVSDLERQGEKWLLLKENDELVALFELKKDRWQEEIPSLVTGNVIDLNNYSCREKVKLQHSKVNEVMQEVFFSNMNMEQLNFLDAYMHDNMYYDVHRKMLKDIKRKLEETHGVKVVLQEITD